MENKIIGWGIKSFYAHTPVWAQHAIVAIFATAASFLILDQANPGLFPVPIEHYVAIATPTLIIIFNAFGIKAPGVTDTTTKS